MTDDELAATLAGHLRRNAALRVALLERGVDPLSRPVDLHFWARGEEAARRLVRALADRGLAARSTADDPSTWSVEAVAVLSPDAVMDPGFVRALVLLAAAHGAVFDGWGTSA